MTLFYYFWRKSKGWSCNMFILRFKLQKCTFVTKTQSRCFLMIRTEHSAVYSCCAHFEQNINTLWVSKYGQKVLQQCSKVWDKMLPWNSLVTRKCAWCLIITKESWLYSVKINNIKIWMKSKITVKVMVHMLTINYYCCQWVK